MWLFWLRFSVHFALLLYSLCRLESWFATVWTKSGQMVGWRWPVSEYLLSSCSFRKAITLARVLLRIEINSSRLFLNPDFSNDSKSNGLTFYYVLLLCFAILSLCFPLLDSSAYTTRWKADDQIHLEATPTLAPRPTSRPTTRSTTRPTLPPRPTGPTVTLCEKRYSIWSYCEARYQQRKNTFAIIVC